jgi:hypothetical protein
MICGDGLARGSVVVERVVVSIWKEQEEAFVGGGMMSGVKRSWCCDCMCNTP